jgi:hypothetical protein
LKELCIMFNYRSFQKRPQFIHKVIPLPYDILFSVMCSNLLPLGGGFLLENSHKFNKTIHETDLM